MCDLQDVLAYVQRLHCLPAHVVVEDYVEALHIHDNFVTYVLEDRILTRIKAIRTLQR